MPHFGSRIPRGFSLVEVLLAIFILGIGLIMIATIFPVGANWTRQTTEDTVAQAIAQNAVADIKDKYQKGGGLAVLGFTNANMLASGANSVLTTGNNPFLLQALPGFTQIPVAERSFQFGATTPYPAPTPTDCTYFWTALCRLNPMHNDGTDHVRPASAYSYDIFILVFRKGSADQVFTLSNLPPAFAGGTEVPNTRAVGETYVPAVVSIPWAKGTYNANATPSITGCTPPIGAIGIGVHSGTVFRQGFDLTNNCAIARPLLQNEVPGGNPDENVIVSPPADNTNASPLIYVYQTTITL